MIARARRLPSSWDRLVRWKSVKNEVLLDSAGNNVFDIPEGSNVLFEVVCDAIDVGAGAVAVVSVVVSLVAGLVQVLVVRRVVEK